MLNPWEVFFFWLGAVMAVLRWRRPTYRLLLLWFAIMIVPALLARTPFAPSTLRMMGAVPAVYLLAGVGVWDFLSKRYFHKHELKPAICRGLVSALILAQGLARTYFQKWAVEYDGYNIYDVDWADLAETLNAQPGTVYLARYKIRFKYPR